MVSTAKGRGTAPDALGPHPGPPDPRERAPRSAAHAAGAAQTTCTPGRPFSTTNEACVSTAAPGRVMNGTTR